MFSFVFWENPRPEDYLTFKMMSNLWQLATIVHYTNSRFSIISCNFVLPAWVDSPYYHRILHDQNHYLGLGQYRNPNWKILSADTLIDTETTFQREYLVTDIIRYIFHYKRAPKKSNLLSNIKYFKITFQGNFSSSKGCQANGDVFFSYRKQENEIINAYYPRKCYFCVW